ncbi:phage tail sheath subtilisin-like domain-containing protein [Leptolyngbya sp. FACHB-261]|uniref:phage tail sheath family protein n=1 Tax=Leptolyngbya sp. FACHB-261 TaxID=2692806 RepID=UPI001685A88E|nr:phage tail sheath subtilisin-like domain-containing protein [Leptolyngbya sp. FACHB-261]MBD2102595.1 phage tail sheath family protein [Leptolyngbya sp. FACHB-261]
MPVTPTYPGVYIEEIPSGVRTITGVATSITAFLGRALRGPVNEPVTVNSFGDFERVFGGLWVQSTLGYAVRDFYLNGGSQAVIVRLFRGDASPADSAAPAAAPPAKAQLAFSTLNLEAASEGAWGNQLQASVNHDVVGSDDDKANLFNLSIKDAGTGQVEVIRNVSVRPDDVRRVDKVLERESQLVRLPGSLPSSRPDVGESEAGASSGGSDGQNLDTNTYSGSEVNKQGLYALEKADLFNLLCIPPPKPGEDIANTVWGEAASYCERRQAMLIIDAPSSWTNKDAAKGDGTSTGVAALGTKSRNAAVFFPHLRKPNPMRGNQVETFAPCGAVAGIFARTDTQRGVWKAPAGIEATLVGVPELSVSLTDAENGELNPLGINCLRTFPAAGRVVWGSRTLQGDDRLASEWKYIPVRRLALFLEESLYRGTQWVVFEPNDEPLWAQIRLNLGAFMNNLFRQGAFQGKSPKEAYFVKCDSETTTQNDINLGIVNIVVGYAPLKPAEFVILKFQQMAGQVAV